MSQENKPGIRANQAKSREPTTDVLEQWFDQAEVARSMKPPPPLPIPIRPDAQRIPDDAQSQVRFAKD